MATRKTDSKIITICYGERKVWNNRQEAANYFFAAMNGSDGAERERYANIYTAIILGEKVCPDTYEDE